MANRIVSVQAGIYGMGIYAILLPSGGFSVAHYTAIKHWQSDTHKMLQTVKQLIGNMNRELGIVF